MRAPASARAGGITEEALVTFSFNTTSFVGWATTSPSGATRTPKPAPRIRCWETMAMRESSPMSAPSTPRLAPWSSVRGTAMVTMSPPVLEST